MTTTAVEPQRSLDSYSTCLKGTAMRKVNTNPASTSSATRRAQRVTDALIAAYIQEISDDQPVSSHVAAPSPPTSTDDAHRPRMAHGRRERSCSRQPALMRSRSEHLPFTERGASALTA
jgi:hypothetical protein